MGKITASLLFGIKIDPTLLNLKEVLTLILVLILSFVLYVFELIKLRNSLRRRRK